MKSVKLSIIKTSDAVKKDVSNPQQLGNSYVKPSIVDMFPKI